MHEQTSMHSPTKKRRTKKRRKDINFADIPGVRKIILSETAQALIGIIVGEHVTSEKPWTLVNKEAVLDNLELHEESSEFLPYKNEIINFPLEKILLGYIPDEQRPYDEFYICITKKAHEFVEEVIAKQQEAQQKRLYNAINKIIRQWTSLGSEKELEECADVKNRPLMQVEVESKYPISTYKTQFRFRKVDDTRDGYMEFRGGDEGSLYLTRKRVDAAIQVAPSVVNNEAQTTCTYPRNDCTQYEYEYFEASVEKEGMKRLVNFVENGYEKCSNMLLMNANINFYIDDYNQLKSIKRSQETTYELSDFKEVMLFMDVKKCANKQISSFTYHHHWTGIAVVAYVDVAPVIYHHSQQNIDTVHRAIHGTNPVLLWSFKDSLNSRLTLEAHREVSTIRFCPFDPNLVIGGCINGQILIWDISNKLERVEQQEIINIKQENYRAYMHSLMHWMKNIYNKALVRCTAVSDLRHSHSGSIVTILWIPQQHEVTKTGKMLENDDETLLSCQFISAAEDGFIHIWDLKKKPSTQAGGFKSVKRLRRLKKKPSALLAEMSPYKIFNLTLTPIFRIKMYHPLDTERLVTIRTMHYPRLNIKYVLESSDTQDRPRIQDRMIYKHKSLIQKPVMGVTFGTTEGEVLTATWDGLDFDSGERVNSQVGKIESYCKFHDGPVITSTHSWLGDITLTLGGKIFALWVDSHPSKPIFWRKCPSVYTYGRFQNFSKCSLMLVRQDGAVEEWYIHHASKKPSRVVVHSNKQITSFVNQPRLVNISHIVTFADTYGALRTYTRSKRVEPPSEGQNFIKFIDREVQRKQDFLKWQSEYTEKYRVVEDTEKVVEQATAVTDLEDEKESKAEKMKKSKLTYIEYEKMQKIKRDRVIIQKTITDKKRLDMKELIKQRKPLQILEEEREKKKRKQRARIKYSDKIFSETIEMLFPDAIQEKKQPPPDPYLSSFSESEKSQCFMQFDGAVSEAIETMKTKPFKYRFNWKDVLILGRERKTAMDHLLEGFAHRNRHNLTKASEKTKSNNKFQEDAISEHSDEAIEE